MVKWWPESQSDDEWSWLKCQLRNIFKKNKCSLKSVVWYELEDFLNLIS